MGITNTHFFTSIEKRGGKDHQILTHSELMAIKTEQVQHYDVIIIGGGLGGLTAGAKLAKEGQKILLIEQHNILGGCATTFKRKNYTMEVGLHAIDGLDKQDPKREIFEELGIFKHIHFVKIPDFFRIINKRFEIVIPSSTEDAIKVLTNRFSTEKKGIKKFFKVIYSIRKEIKKLPAEKSKIAAIFPVFPFFYPNIFYYSFKTVGEFLDSIITNEDLKLILLANIFCYHDDPYSLSLIYFSAAQASYFNGGTHYIKGGSQKLSNYLAKIIKKNNGEIILNKLVTEIITEKNKAIGVRYQDTSNKKTACFAKKIIANTAIPNVAYLLDKNNALLIQKKTSNLKKSCSLLSIYIGFKIEPKKIGNKNYCTFIIDESVKSINNIKNNFKENFSKRNFCFVDYSQIDSNLAPSGKSVGTICVADYFYDWEKLNDEEYKKRKAEIAHILLTRLEKLFPGISKTIECYEVGTPKTIQKYTLNPEGAVYGFAQIPKQAGVFRLSNRSPIKNLYFASAWTYPGGGFTGAIMSGWFCAGAVSSKK